METNSKREVLLSVRNLEQFFKLGKFRVNKAVNDISFDIYKGEVFGLVGESGCGKTTTGRTIIRLYQPTGGSVYFRGQRIVAGCRTYKQMLKTLMASNKKDKGFFEESKRLREEIRTAKRDQKCNSIYSAKQMLSVNNKYMSQLAIMPDGDEKTELQKEFKKELKLASKDRVMNKIQMIFQDPIASLDPRMIVKDIVAEGLVIRGIKDKQYITEQVYRVLSLVGLQPEHATRYPHEFSGGQRQRIGIARAIILNPELIIADEPISALDVSIQAQVINLLNELRETLGLTIMFIAHDLSVVKYFSDRIAVMYFGKIVEMATSEELFKNPLHPYTKSLLSAIPIPDPNQERNRIRIIYNPVADHDYKTDKPLLREISPEHFVNCNDEEFEKYSELLKS